jgi:hypothetical protein
VPTRYLNHGQPGVYRSDDGGLTWTLAVHGLTGLHGSARILLSVHADASTNAVYAMVIESSGLTLSGVFRSQDQGANWETLGTPPEAIFNKSQGDIHGAIAADPNDPNGFFIAGDGEPITATFPDPEGATSFTAIIWHGAYSSTGTTWQVAVDNGANGTAPHNDSRALLFDANGNLLEASDGGIAKLASPNDTAHRQWVSLNNNLADAEILFAAYDPLSKVFIAGAQDNSFIVQERPGSTTWDNFFAGDGVALADDANQTEHPGVSIRYTSVEFFQFFSRSYWDANNHLVSFRFVDPKIVSGPGAGQDIYSYNPFLQYATPFVLNAIDPSRILIGSSTLYESFDHGDTLTNLGFSNGSFVGGLSVENGILANFGYGKPLVYGGRLGGIANPDVIYAGVGSQIVHRVHRGDPLSVLSSYPGTNVQTIVVNPDDYRQVFAVDDHSQVWASADEGASWRNITRNLLSLVPIPTGMPLIDTLEYVKTGASDGVLLAGAQNGVFALRDPLQDGRLWSGLGNNLPHVLVQDLRYDSTDNLLVAGTLGRGVWSLSQPFDATGQGQAPGASSPLFEPMVSDTTAESLGAQARLAPYWAQSSALTENVGRQELSWTANAANFSPPTVGPATDASWAGKTRPSAAPIVPQERVSSASQGPRTALSVDPALNDRARFCDSPGQPKRGGRRQQRPPNSAQPFSRNAVGLVFPEFRE